MPCSHWGTSLEPQLDFILFCFFSHMQLTPQNLQTHFWVENWWSYHLRLEAAVVHVLEGHHSLSLSIIILYWMTACSPGRFIMVSAKCGITRTESTTLYFPCCSCFALLTGLVKTVGCFMPPRFLLSRHTVLVYPFSLGSYLVGSFILSVILSLFLFLSFFSRLWGHPFKLYRGS